MTGAGLPKTSYKTGPKMLDAVANGKSQAAVYDQPIMRYLTLTAFDGVIDVLPSTFERQDYAFAIPLKSPLQKTINQVLLEELNSPEWAANKRLYLGEN